MSIKSCKKNLKLFHFGNLASLGWLDSEFWGRDFFFFLMFQAMGWMILLIWRLRYGNNLQILVDKRKIFRFRGIERGGAKKKESLVQFNGAYVGNF